LTTIRQDRKELGTLAAACAVELIEDPDADAQEITLPVELVVRASSSPG
jgi:DNA-binding LacI/PurR family transcriptional regulator